MYNAEEDYRYGRYWDSLDEYKIILSNIQKPQAVIYERCGELYVKLDHISTAINYYEMAYKLYEEENNYAKDSIKYTLDNLYNQRTKKIIIPNTIYNYVEDIINNNLDIKSLEQSLDNNTLMHIYLLLAEYYYQEQEYIEGDKYIDLVINNIIRSKEINKLLNNIIRNKYKYKRINNRIRIFTRDCN